MARRRRTGGSPGCRSLQPCDVPGVDDLGVVLGRDGDTAGREGVVGTGIPRAPSPRGRCRWRSSSARRRQSHRDGTPVPRGRGSPAIREAPRPHHARIRGRALVRQPAAGRAGAPVPDHHRPGGRHVDEREFLEHVAELERRQRRAAELGGGLQPEQPQRAQRRDAAAGASASPRQPPAASNSARRARIAASSSATPPAIEASGTSETAASACSLIHSPAVLGYGHRHRGARPTDDRRPVSELG